MVDNENKNINQEESNKVVKGSQFISSFIAFSVTFLLLFLLNGLFGGYERPAPTPIETITLESFVEDTEVRCVGMTAVYEVDGTKNYQVRFSASDYSMYFEALVPASVVDVDKVLDKDSKYKADITYTYSKEVLEKVKTNAFLVEEYDTDAEYLRKIDKSEEIMRITNVEFMFSDYLTLQTKEEVQTEFEELFIVKEEKDV